MTTSYESSDDARVAIAAACAGADMVRNMYGQRLSRIDKGAGDFATDADVAAEAAILGVFRAARPEDAVLGEEGGQQGSATAARQWLVDPLCGTLNYAVGDMLVALCAGPPAAWSPGSTAARSAGQAADLSWPPTPGPTSC